MTLQMLVVFLYELFVLKAGRTVHNFLFF